MAEIKQIATRIEPVPVYREGMSVWEEEFPVLVYEDGEVGLEVETAMKVEERQKHYLELAERGELPEPTSTSCGCTLETMKELVVYRDGDRVWQEQFPVRVAEDGEVLLSYHTALAWEGRKSEYLKLAKEGTLPEPSETSAKGSHEAAGG